MVPDLPTAAESAADSTNEIRKGRECRDKRCCGRSATSGRPEPNSLAPWDLGCLVSKRNYAQVSTLLALRIH